MSSGIFLWPPEMISEKFNELEEKKKKRFLVREHPRRSFVANSAPVGRHCGNASPTISKSGAISI